MSPHSVNLLDPFQGRRWLRLLEPDAECGFRLKPGLNLPSSGLGFSMNSNRFGLRGPADARGPGVVFGTSFAMGIAVNNGENWWDLALPESGWMNLGLAVGFREWENLLGRFYSGTHERAWLLYHPNFWVHCRMYERWRKSGLDVFQALRWRTSLPWCAYLKLRRAWRRPQMLESGRLLKLSSTGFPMEVETEYVNLPFGDDDGFFERNLALLTGMLSRFREVSVVRLRVKQELVPEPERNDRLRNTCAVYDRWFDETCSRLGALKGLRVHEPPAMSLGDYLPIDTHWNARGNRTFATWLKERV